MKYDAEKQTKHAKLSLCTFNTEKYVNLVIYSDDDGRVVSNTTLNTGGDVEWLRDQLNELYPPPQKVEPEAGEYFVEPRTFRAVGDAAFKVVRDVKKVVQETVALTHTEEQAKKVAQALNEAEGL